MQGIVDILTRFALAGCGVVAAAVMLAAGLVAFAPRSVCEPFRRIADFAVRRPFAAIVMAILLVLGPVRDAVTKVTNAPLRGASVELGVENGKWKVENGGVVAVGDTTILHSTFSTLHSFRLEAETTNETYSYAMPTNGMRRESWWLRGAYEDVFRQNLGGMLFPLGTSLCDSLWVYTWGMAGARLGDASNRVVATGTPMSAVPQISRFWDASTTSGSHLLTWENFFLNRDTNTPVSAQLELMPSGDFIARSNLVERLYRRVNPDDWDDDGIPNEEDDDPLAYDGDNFGPHQTLPEGANTNAYCWVDLVVPNANSLVTFTGDGYSALPDPTFIARAGDTNRVILLIGKTYQVSSRLPISCIDQSSGDIEVYQTSLTELQIIWPVAIEANSMRSGASFSMSVRPDCLGGGFVWTNSCCNIGSLGGGVFAYSCNDACHCGGCFATGYYGYEGYSLPACGGWCGCSGAYDPSPEQGDDEGPYGAGASATFSKSAVIFEDGYWNTPTNWVERQSTQTELHCVAHGGQNGGHVRFEISGKNKLERVSGRLLPVEQDVSPGKKLDFTVVYRGQLPSTNAEDIVVTTTFTENAEGATPVSSQSKLTSVKTLLVPTCLIEGAPNRHCLGLRENFVLEIIPSEVNASVSRNSGWDLNSVINIPVYSCPIFTDGNGIAIHVGNATYMPQLSVVEPKGIVCTSGRSACGYGVIAMQLEPYIIPECVSYSNIKMMEVPSMEGGPTGYFTNSIFEAYWHHTTNRGAGVWHRPTASNFFFEDFPSFDLYCPPPLSGGTINWVVPIGWGEDGASSLEDIVGTMSTLYNQVYTLDTDGGLRIDKFGQWIKMDVSGGITHSPGISEQ